MKGVWQTGWILTIAALSMAGCGGPGVSTAKVTGKVTVAGQPMQGITVSFLPASGKPATGLTDASGNFALATFSKEDGAVLGKHKVSFNFSTIQASPTGAPSSADYMKRPTDKSAESQGRTVPFNAKYTSPDTSGIEVEVKSGTNVLPPWDLEK